MTPMMDHFLSVNQVRKKAAQRLGLLIPILNRSGVLECNEIIKLNSIETNCVS
jgi:hypothetical protein